MKVAYRRVSSVQQNMERQEFSSDVEKIFEDRQSGKNADRPGLKEMVDYVRDGDSVEVYSIDRLARDLRDLLSIVETLIAKSVTVHFIKENLTFSNNKDDPFSQLTLQIAGAFADFERRMIVSRVREGVAKAVAAGKYKGRKKTIDDKKILDLLNKGYKKTEIADELGISRQTIYRAIKNNLASV